MILSCVSQEGKWNVEDSCHKEDGYENESVDFVTGGVVEFELCVGVCVCVWVCLCRCVCGVCVGLYGS